MTRALTTSALLLTLLSGLAAPIGASVGTAHGQRARVDQTQAEPSPRQQPGPAAQQQAPVVGKWLGRMIDLRILMTVSAAEGSETELTATVVSLDQGGQEIPAADVTFSGDSLHVDMPTIGGGYEAVLVHRDRLEGTWSQSGQKLPLSMERVEGDSIPGPERPQEPEPPFPYEVSDVSVENAEDGITLAGTYTRPEGEGPFPAVVLVTGSGPQDRNETVAGHKPFLVLADHLTRQGIAVLRMDDRGVGESEGDFESATSVEFARDAEAGARWLHGREEVDTGAVGLVGHSEGGLIAPMASNRDDDIDFLVLLAGPGVPGSEIITAQTRRILETSGMPGHIIDWNDTLLGRFFEIVRTLPPEERDAAARRAYREAVEALSPSDREMLGLTDSAAVETSAAREGGRMARPWMAFFLSHDPAVTLEKVDVPVLALNGSLDVQVLPEQNLPPIRDALADSHPDSEVRKLDGLNHLFQPAATGLPVEYSAIETTMAPEALNAVSAWILEVTGHQ